MTEPVAYIRKTSKGTYISKTPISNDYGAKTDKTLPLYTREQLKPKVQMTNKEFEEWKELYYHLVEFSLGIHNMLDDLFNDMNEKNGKYIELTKRLYQDYDFMTFSKKQAELVNLFINYSPDNPEETIEIVPDMKWFVRSKERDDDDDYAFLAGIETPNEWTYSKRHDDVICAYPFDTQEEAELWLNPLTEAVQLPVEGE